MKRWIHASAAPTYHLKKLADLARDIIEGQIADPIEFGDVEFDHDGFRFEVIDMDKGYWDGVFEFKMPEDGDPEDYLKYQANDFVDSLDIDI